MRRKKIEDLVKVFPSVLCRIASTTKIIDKTLQGIDIHQVIIRFLFSPMFPPGLETVILRMCGTGSLLEVRRMGVEKERR